MAKGKSWQLALEKAIYTSLEKEGKSPVAKESARRKGGGKFTGDGGRGEGEDIHEERKKRWPPDFPRGNAWEGEVKEVGPNSAGPGSLDDGKST